MAGLRIIDAQLYVDNGDGSYSPIDLRGQGGGGGNSATLECKCNNANREKIKQILLGESHYREKPGMDPLSYEYISDYVYNLLTSYNQDLSEFEIYVDIENNYNCDGYDVTVNLRHTKSGRSSSCKFTIFYGAAASDPTIANNLKKLVKELITTIKIIKKENDIMAQYQYACGKFEAIKTQEEIELEEKLAKLNAEYDKKVAKLREEFKATQEKKERDAKAKEIHDKYQSLIDAGFTEEKAWEILKTKTMLGEFEL